MKFNEQSLNKTSRIKQCDKVNLLTKDNWLLRIS